MRREAWSLAAAAAGLLMLSACAGTAPERDGEAAFERGVGAAAAAERRRLWEETLSYSEALAALPAELRERAHVQQQVEDALAGAAAQYREQPKVAHLMRFGLLAVLARADDAVLAEVQRDLSAYVARVGLSGERDEWLVSARLLLYIMGERAQVREERAALARQRAELAALQQELVKRMLAQESAHAQALERAVRENRELRASLAAQEAEFNDKLEQLKGIERQLHERTGADEGLP